MPTEGACCVQDRILRINQGEFSYFTGPNSFHPEKIIKGEPPNIKKRPNKQSAITDGTGSKEDRRREAVMREFVREYGKGIRQENVRLKTKELTGTLPYALSMRPILITASSEDSQDITAAYQIVDANVTLLGGTVRVQTIYHKEDVDAVRHDRRREISLFWLAVLLEDVQVEVHDGKFLRQKVALQWLNQTSDPLTYTPGDTCNRNSPKCILTRVVGYTEEDANITLSSEEDTRLCRLANGDLSYDEDVEDAEVSLIQQQNLQRMKGKFRF